MLMLYHSVHIWKQRNASYSTSKIEGTVSVGKKADHTRITQNADAIHLLK